MSQHDEPRLGGVILHPTSLPGPHGSGDFGPAAFHFIDWLAAGAITAWQVLPLTPPGFGGSPYAGVSAFAGSPQLIALEPLIERGWLAPIDADELDEFSATKVVFDKVAPWRMAKLRAAFAGFDARAHAHDRATFDAFCREHAAWLDDYALFMALDSHFAARGINLWTQWDRPLARREPAAMTAARTTFASDLRFWQFVQWNFRTQWDAIKRYANGKGIALVGDLPIFVALHSVDCWARPDCFLLDADLQPTVVAGVPPDYFSATGQRWGNPLYDWAAMQRDGFAWWIARLRNELARADLVRIDHFRGFAAYWEIPATSPTAIDGRWVQAPGDALFDALRRALGRVPVIAEDLGIITPDVEALRDKYGLPGMKVLQFAFGGDARHAYLPHTYPANCCAYTGTHDNDTTAGWWRNGASDPERLFAGSYLQCNDDDVHWQMIRAAWASVARFAACPMQDVLGLGSEHRLNTPGQLDCWSWRFQWDQVGPEPARRLASLAITYGRAPFDAARLVHDSPSPSG